MGNFELFKPVNKTKNTKNTYSIQAGVKNTGYFSGMVYFNGGMRDALQLDRYKHVELYTDKDSKLIAVRFVVTPSENTRALRKNGNHYFITCSSWLHVAVNDLGYPEKGSGSYRVLDDGLVLLEKGQE